MGDDTQQIKEEYSTDGWLYMRHYIKNNIVSALVPGLGTTLKYFFKKELKISLEPANINYEPIVLDPDQVTLQGKLLAVWRKM